MQNRYDLVVLVICSLLFPLFIGVDFLYGLRVVWGVAYILLFPGYALMAVLFPDRDSIDIPERLAFSAGLSVVVVSLIGLGLNSTVWGVGLNAILLSLTTFIVICSGGAYYRWMRLAPKRRFVIELRLERFSWNSMAPGHKISLIALALSVATLAGLIGIAVSSLGVDNRHTQFYLLSADRTIDDYPRVVEAGEPITIVLGVINQEQSDMLYYIEQVDDTGIKQIAPLHLRHGETWEQPHTFTLTEPEENRRITFLLYRAGDDGPYRYLHLWITVN